MVPRLVLFLSLFYVTWGKCGLDWAEFSGECLYLSRDAREWVDANTHCRAIGGYLASDDSQEKHNTLTQLVSLFHVYNEKTFWIGGDDYIFEGTWRWTETGTTIGPYTRWKAGSPSTNTSKNCIAMTWEGDDLYWFDDHCRYWRDTKAKTSGGRYYYICEKPVPANPNIVG